MLMTWENVQHSLNENDPYIVGSNQLRLENQISLPEFTHIILKE